MTSHLKGVSVETMRDTAKLIGRELAKTYALLAVCKAEAGAEEGLTAEEAKDRAKIAGKKATILKQQMLEWETRADEAVAASSPGEPVVASDPGEAGNSPDASEEDPAS
jgi:hypothetical protein